MNYNKLNFRSNFFYYQLFFTEKNLKNNQIKNNIYKYNKI